MTVEQKALQTGVMKALLVSEIEKSTDFRARLIGDALYFNRDKIELSFDWVTNICYIKYFSTERTKLCEINPKVIVNMIQSQDFAVLEKTSLKKESLKKTPLKKEQKDIDYYILGC